MVGLDTEIFDRNNVRRASSAASTGGHRTDVLLICPPFQFPGLSSLSIAQQASFLRAKGVGCDEAYVHMDFFRILGKDKYEEINSAAGGRDNGQTAELLFAEGLHGEIADDRMRKRLEALTGSAQERRAVLFRFEKRIKERLEKKEG